MINKESAQAMTKKIDRVIHLSAAELSFGGKGPQLKGWQIAEARNEERKKARQVAAAAAASAAEAAAARTSALKPKSRIVKRTVIPQVQPSKPRFC